MTDLDRNGC